VWGRVPIIRFAQPCAHGRKVSDEYSVPVCLLCHGDLHGYGDEASWWARVSIDPLPIALAAIAYPAPLRAELRRSVIPSHHKWFRNLAVSQIMADTIDQHKPATLC
jgi:hypothetical protein